jgi:chromosome partitioning protein
MIGTCDAAIFRSEILPVDQYMVFENVVPFNVAFKECVVARQPLAIWKPKTVAAKAIDAVAAEILARIDKLRASDQGRGAA